MTVKLPSVTFIDLPGGYRWVEHEVKLAAWQTHLLKHPLGIGALRRARPGPWNEEGWDKLDPPAITAETREQLAKDVAGLVFDKQRCEVRELRGKRSTDPTLECERCEPPLIIRCAKRLSAEPTPARYQSETERLVRAVSDGKVVSRGALLQRLFAALKEPPAWWDGLVVMSVGRDGTLDILRISDSDGFRTDFYIDAHKQLRWRTTYRNPKNTTNARLSWVMETQAPALKLSLSEEFVIPRDWADRHEI